MKKSSTILTVCGMLLFLAACGPNKAELKRQEVAQRDLGGQFLRAGDYTKALNHLVEAEKLFADDPILQNYLGLAYNGKNKQELAIQHYTKALKLKPDYAPAKNNLGAAYLAQEKWDDAIGVYKELTGDLLYATPHYPLSNLGYAYYRKKEYRLSEKYYVQALKLEPTHPPALWGLGQTYVAMGRGEEAISALSIVVDRYPEYTEGHYTLAQAYMLVKNYSKAKSEYKKVIALDPGSPMARDAEKKVYQLRYVK